MMTQYLENVREIERRIQRAENSQGDEDLLLPARPAGVPFDYEEHIKLMYDLMTLAYQADVTRVITFMVSREVSNRTYPQVGVTDGHHAISHHQNRAEKMEKNVKIQTYNISQFGYFLEKLKNTPDGDGSLLDHAALLYGSNMSNSNAHDHYPLPNLVVGGAVGRMQGGRHLKYADHTPMTNLLVTMLDKVGREAGIARRQLGALEQLVVGGRRYSYEFRLTGPQLMRIVISHLSCRSARADHGVRRRDGRQGSAAGAGREGRRQHDGDRAARQTRRSEHRRARRHDAASLGRAQQRRRARRATHSRRRRCQSHQSLRHRRNRARLRERSAAILEKLIAAGVSANATGPYGETALHTCAHSGKVEAAKVLIAHGASLDAGDSWRGQTPLMWAAAEGHPDMMRALIEAGADVNARSTIIAWERQRTSEPRDKWLPPGGLTPMLFAAREGCVECVKVLISSGADANIVDPDQYSPLVLALINGHFDVAGALIDAGANLNMQDKVGRTAAVGRRRCAHDAIVQPALLRARPTTRLSSMDIITKLLDRGANVDVPLRAQVPYRTKLDRGGDGVLGAGTTPLLRAAKAGDVPVIKMLLAKGANPRAVTSRGNVNAIMMAANVSTREEDMTGRNKTQKEAIESIRLLLAAGTDINGVDTQGRTAAHGAALWGMDRRGSIPPRERRSNSTSRTSADTRRLIPRSDWLAVSGSAALRASRTRKRPKSSASLAACRASRYQGRSRPQPKRRRSAGQQLSSKVEVRSRKVSCQESRREVVSGFSRTTPWRQNHNPRTTRSTRPSRSIRVPLNRPRLMFAR